MINYLEDHSIYQVGKQNVAKTMPCLPPMTGNGKFIPHKNADKFGDGAFMALFYALTQL